MMPDLADIKQWDSGGMGTPKDPEKDIVCYYLSSDLEFSLRDEPPIGNLNGWHSVRLNSVVWREFLDLSDKLNVANNEVHRLELQQAKTLERIKQLIDEQEGVCEEAN